LFIFLQPNLFTICGIEDLQRAGTGKIKTVTENLPSASILVCEPRNKISFKNNLI
jgi:hypothetical protein